MISSAHLRLLRHLSDIGGGAPLDQFGRLMDGARALPGKPEEWVFLASMGYVGGEHGKLILTEKARNEVQQRAV